MTRYRTSFDTPEQAFTEALFLGLMAPGDEEAQASLEVYARKLSRDRETGKRMDALVDWAQMGTNVGHSFAALMPEATRSAA